VMMQKHGTDMPAERYNHSSIAMLKSNALKIDKLMQRITANLSLLRSKE